MPRLPGASAYRLPSWSSMRSRIARSCRMSSRKSRSSPIYTGIRSRAARIRHTSSTSCRRSRRLGARSCSTPMTSSAAASRPRPPTRSTTPSRSCRMTPTGRRESSATSRLARIVEVRWSMTGAICGTSGAPTARPAGSPIRNPTILSPASIATPTPSRFRSAAAPMRLNTNTISEPTRWRTSTTCCALWSRRASSV